MKNIPKISDVRLRGLPHVNKYLLSNNIPVYEIRSGIQPVVRFEIVFRAGRPCEHKKLVSKACAELLREGTRKHTSATLADRIERFGARYHMPNSLDYIMLTFSCLSKHCKRLIPISAEICQFPLFSERELERFKKYQVQKLSVDEAENDIVAYRKITEMIFGSDHPYGYNSDKALYYAIARDDLILHYEQWVNPSNCAIFVSGNAPSGLANSIEEHFGSWNNGQAAIPPSRLDLHQRSPDTFVLSRYQKQTSIRVGRRLFGRNNPDYPGFFGLNTVLGGFFGSRLIKNIREQRGYTYNIHSTIEPHFYDGCWYISTDTKLNLVNRTLNQINIEIDKLRQEMIPEGELEMVKNYLRGYLLSLLDGPLNVLEVIKTSILETGRTDYIVTLFDKLAELRSEDLMALAQKYLSGDVFDRVIID
jgi:zinc protease